MSFFRRWIYIFSALTLTFLSEGFIFCQKYETPNIVPNSGFELIETPPDIWFNHGKDFSSCAKYWFSPTEASPDVYGPGVDVPYKWSRLGFGKASPRRGRSMAGMTVYGCEGGKPHCREYIQVQLTEPLVVGQKYYVELYIRHMDATLESSNIGFYFSEEPIWVPGDPVLEYTPQVNYTNIIQCTNYWKKIHGEFTAKEEANFLTIGNFFGDTSTKTKKKKRESHGYAYYYVDEVTVQKAPPVLPVPIKEDDIRLSSLEAGSIIHLKHIYFDSDKCDLHPRAFQELDKLVEIMTKIPDLNIEIRGHTDSMGRESYNITLSKDRARSVFDYLTSKDIFPGRLEYKGYGSLEPIASNDSESGRRQNRRVEIRILD